MPVGEICNREVVIVQRNATVLDAARLMRSHHVGSLVAIEEISGVRRPVGLVTDRDLVVEVLAPGLDASVITIDDIVLASPITVSEHTGVFESIQYMRDKAVRRLIVVNDEGGLIGIVTMDDLLSMLAEELGQLSALVAREHARESHSRP